MVAAQDFPRTTTSDRMKFVVLTIVLGLIATACRQPSSPDAALRQKLVGTWVFTAGTKGGGGVTTFDADGNSVTDITNRWTGGSKEFHYQAKWKIKNANITFTYVKTSEPEYLPVGKSEHCQILKVDEQELVFLDSSDNHTNILQRSN